MTSAISAGVSPLRRAGPDVQGQLALGPQRGQHGDRDTRAGAPIELVAGPQPAPRRLGDPALEVGVDPGRGRRPVDVGIAEHLSTDPHPGVVRVVAHLRSWDRARLAAIRVGSTRSRRSDSPTQWAAEPVARSRPWRAGHSACHAPAARSASPLPAAVQQRGDEPRHLHRGGARRDGGDRVALVRHRRRAADAFRLLGDLADVVLGEEHDVEPDLGARRRRRAPRAGDVSDPRPLGVARCGGDVELEALGEVTGDLLVARAEGSAVAARPAEPDPLAGGAIEPTGRRRETVAPPAGHGGERRGHGVLAERAGDHR